MKQKIILAGGGETTALPIYYKQNQIKLNYEY